VLDAFDTINVAIYQAVQQLSGHSWCFDSLISHATHNPLVKAGVIGGCFFAAWFATVDESSRRTRKTLLLTLCAGVLAIAVSKLIAANVLSPRPLLCSSQLYVTNGQLLDEAQRLDIRVPLDSAGRGNYRKYQSGDFGNSDLRSFPSDHAALYVGISVGLFFVSKKLGILSLAWTLVVIVAPRVVSGMHWPVDVVAGGAIGAATTLGMLSFFENRSILGLDSFVGWTIRRPAISSALVFVAVFETCNSYFNLRMLLKFGMELARRLLSN